MNWRWIVVVTTAITGLWGLITVSMVNEGTPLGQAAAESAAIILLAGILGALFMAGLEWAMRGDR